MKSVKIHRPVFAKIALASHRVRRFLVVSLERQRASDLQRAAAVCPEYILVQREILCLF
jgi:hypothetical protein